MARNLDDLHIEVMDDDMARILRSKTGAERLKIASDMFASAPPDDRQPSRRGAPGLG